MPNLDEILGGGLPDRSLVLVLGVPGSGKTILAEQIAVHHARLGERAIIFTALSESHERMLAELGEFSFADPAVLGDALRLYSVQTVLDRGLDAVAETIVESARREHATFIVLDGFHGIAHFATTGREVDRFLYALRSRLTLLGATVLVTYEAVLDARHSYGTLTIADGILVLHNALDGERHRRWVEVAKLRGMRHLDGLHTLTITDAGIACYPRQEAAYRAMAYTVGEERVSLGLPELDAMLGGGFNRGTSTFLAGSPGTGKTLVSLHYLMAGVAAGEPGIYVALAESAAQLTMKGRSFGLDVEGAVARGDITLLTIPPADLNVDILAAMLRERVERLGIRRLVIDPIGVVEYEIPFPKRTPRYLSSLLNYLRERGVTSLLTQESSAFDGGGIGDTLASVLADNIIVLQSVAIRDRLFRILSVRKMRHSDFDPSLREFRIEGGTVRVAPVAESGAETMGGITAQERRGSRMTRRNRRQ